MILHSWMYSHKSGCFFTFSSFASKRFCTVHIIRFRKLLRLGWLWIRWVVHSGMFYVRYVHHERSLDLHPTLFTQPIWTEERKRKKEQTALVAKPPHFLCPSFFIHLIVDVWVGIRGSCPILQRQSVPLQPSVTGIFNPQWLGANVTALITLRPSLGPLSVFLLPVRPVCSVIQNNDTEEWITGVYETKNSG